MDINESVAWDEWAIILLWGIDKNIFLSTCAIKYYTQS